MPQPRKIRVTLDAQVFEFDLSLKSTAVLETADYKVWSSSIADKVTKARIYKDVGKMERGLFGDWKEVDGVYEMRLDYGPGYRVYYSRIGSVVIILLGGGDKSSQKADIKKAQDLWKGLKDAIAQV